MASRRLQTSRAQIEEGKRNKKVNVASNVIQTFGNTIVRFSLGVIGLKPHMDIMRKRL